MCRWALVMVFAVAGSSSAGAELVRFARETETTVTFADLTFQDAVADYRNQLRFRGTSEDPARSDRWRTLNTFVDFAVSVSDPGQLNFPTPVFDPFVGIHVSDYQFSLNAPVAADASISIGYRTPAIFGFAGGADSFLAVSTVFVDDVEHWALTFTGGGSGGLDLDGRFFSRLAVAGRWDRHGSGLGSAIVSFDSAYAVLEDWVYDPAADQTILTVETTRYNGFDPDFRVVLTGAPVPGPGTVGALISVGLAAARRPRRARPRP